MKARALLFGLAAPLATGCKPPPEAPTRLEELCGYVFHHMGDDPEDTEALLAGVDNLSAWLDKGDNLTSTLEGYQITNLDQAAVDALDISNARSVDALVGAAVANEHPYSVGEVARTTVIDDWAQVVEGNYEVYERDFAGDPGCFPGRECLELEASSYGLSSWAGLVDVESWNDIQFRWIETEAGWVLLHRSWLTRPAEVSWESIEVNAQYFLAVTLPGGGDSALRVQATWIEADYGALPIGEDSAKTQIVKSMQDQGEAINDWLDGE